MANLDTLNLSELQNELFDLARDQGTSTREDWNSLVEEVLAAHLDLGELDPDQDIEGAKASLREAWEIYASQADSESQNAIEEDPEAPKA